MNADSRVSRFDRINMIYMMPKILFIMSKSKSHSTF